MSAIVSGIVNSTIGLVCNKIRDYTAQEMDEGDIIDSELRQTLVRELDDIKTKLDGLSRKDLLASISFFKEGVTELYNSLEITGESCEMPSTSQAHTDDDEPEGATAMTVKQFEGDAIDTTFDFRKFFGNLKISSKERYRLAKKSFENAKRMATQAFCNTALSTEDRVMASKVRITSRILGGLDDPEAAVQSCLLYLKELQNLRAVQATFTVWRGKGFTSRLRALFSRTKRNAMVESIEAITGWLLNLILHNTNMRTDRFNWPTINTSEEIYHPILRQKERMKELQVRRYNEQDPRKFQTEIVYRDCAATSTGKILSRPRYEDDQDGGIKISKPNGECSKFCTIPSDNDGHISGKVCCFAVDENDNVYIVIETPSRDDNDPATPYKLLPFNENGIPKADRFLDIEELLLPQMTVTKGGKLLICCYKTESVYICDSTNAERDYKFPLPLEDVNHSYIYTLSFTTSDQNEIIYTFLKYSDDKSFSMHIITMDGEVKHEKQVPANTSVSPVINVVFNHVKRTILVSLYNLGEDHISLFIFSKTGEQLYDFEMKGWNYHKLTSHPNGTIALVDKDKVMLLECKLTRGAHAGQQLSNIS